MGCVFGHSLKMKGNTQYIVQKQELMGKLRNEADLWMSITSYSFSELLGPLYLIKKGFLSISIYLETFWWHYKIYYETPLI